MPESSNDNDPAEAKSVGTCAICGNPRSEAYRPFCSKRCADADLGRWLKGDYAIPVMEDDDEDGATAGRLPPEMPNDPEGGGPF
ncbi:MAG: DNA gyrase inhibitor YacG [Hyphomicrobiales bacterium]|nr:DNA gyrase inhibitor YacG [Hyphomicrobiales bacterium]